MAPDDQKRDVVQISGMCDRSTFHFGTVTAEGLYQPVLFLMAGNKLVTAYHTTLKYLYTGKNFVTWILWQLFEDAHLP